MAILEVQDIHTYYGDAYVLQGLSLQLEQGQILGLLGRNGVGKTTLVKSIVGFSPPRRGKVVFKGDDITRKASFETVRSGMGLVPQGRSWPRMPWSALFVFISIRRIRAYGGVRGWRLPGSIGASARS